MDFDLNWQRHCVIKRLSGRFNGNLISRSSHRRCSAKKVFLEISLNLQESTCGKAPCRACNFIKKETLAKVFSLEFYEIFKNTFFTEHLRTSASGPQNSRSNANITKNIIICGNIALFIALWSDIFFAYIALKPISTFLHQFYRGGLANFAGSAIISFFTLTEEILNGKLHFLCTVIAYLIIQWFNHIATMDLAAAPPAVFLHWQPCLMVSFYLFLSPSNSLGTVWL